MCASVKKIFSGSQLAKCNVLKINAVIPSPGYILLSGIVYNPKGEPLANCAITVNEIDRSVIPHKKKFVGVTFTTQDGSYGMSLKKPGKCSYELKAYCSGVF